MREFRTSGSAGGPGSNPPVYPTGVSVLRTPAFNTEKRSVGGLTEGDLAGRGSGGLAPYRGPVEAVAALEPSSSGASARTSARPAATIGSTTSHSPVELRATPSPREPDPLDRRFLQGSNATARHSVRGTGGRR